MYYRFGYLENLMRCFHAGGFYWRYYPTVKGAAVTPLTVMMQMCYLALCLTPVILNRREDHVWKHLQSEI
nr:hypothetical protein [uncultured Acetatifactor sp.]